MTEPVIGGTYRHYKNKVYRVLMIAKFERTEEDLVIYEAQYPNDLARVWARPVAEFLETVRTDDYEGPRFTLT